MQRRARDSGPVLRLILAAALGLVLAGPACRKSGDASGDASGRERTLPDNVELSAVEGVSIIQCPASDDPSWAIYGDGNSQEGTAETAPLSEMIYSWCDFDGWIFIDADLPDARYNVKVTAGEGQSLWPAAKKAFEEAFALRFNEGKEILDVWVFQKAEDPPRGLTRVEATSSNWGTDQTPGGFGYVVRAGTMHDLTKIILKYVDGPVIDETGLEGYYKFTLSMDHWEPETLFPGIEGLGLKVEQAKRELVVMRVVSAPREAPASLPHSGTPAP